MVEAEARVSKREYRTRQLQLIEAFLADQANGFVGTWDDWCQAEGIYPLTEDA